MAVWLRVAMVVLVAAMPPAPSRAQGTGIALGSLAHDSGLPVEITAQALSVAQSDGTAVFSGDVLVGQGDMRLSADRVRVVYAPGDAEAGRRIARLEAEGSVLLTLGADAAEAGRAIYTIDTGQLVLSGNVLLTQGASAIAGQRLEIDLQRGTGIMAGGVRTVFQPSGRAE